MSVRSWFLTGLIFSSVFSVQAVVLRPSFSPRYSGAEIGEWTMDHATALAKAREGTNNVIVMFNGAWWCPHCQALEKTVLTNQAWQAYVQTNRMYLVMMDNPGRNDDLWCWLRETNYYQNAGLDHAQAEAAITNHYAIQTSYAVPGAPTQTVKGVSYVRVGYPTLIVLRPDGTRLGRFSPLVTTVSLEMAIRNVNQILAADAGDETDNFYQGATQLAQPPCDAAEVDTGNHTLSESDGADWYTFNANDAGKQWSFALRTAAVGITNDVRVQIYDNPTSTVAVAERVMTPSDISVLSYVAPKTGQYWLKISSVLTLRQLQGYDLAYWYDAPPATVLFAAPQVSLSEAARSVTLTVNITGASAASEVHVAYETLAGSAQPGQDYVDAIGELVWAAGAAKRPKTITIQLLPDAVWEGDETFSVQLYAVRSCEVGSQLSVCTVSLKELTARQPGKLSFGGANAAVLVEGSNAVFSVTRTAGVNGAVTARVEHVEGALRTPVAQLVWTNNETVAKTFSFGFATEPGFQPDRTSSLHLTPLGGASLASSTGATISLTRRDDLVVQTLAQYVADPSNQVFGLKASSGLWFYGFCSDDERDAAWLRSGIVAKGSSAILSSVVQGPGVLGFDWRLDGSGALAQCLVGGSAVAVTTNAGFHIGAALAIASGKQTVTWSVKHVTGAAGVSAAVRNLSWSPLPQTAAPLPADKAAVINRALAFSWQDVLASATFPAGVTVRYEFYAGPSAWSLAKWSEQSEAVFPRAGNEADQAALSALIAKANSKPLYWRVDTVATDELGHRAVQVGHTWSVTVLPEGAPEYVASEGGYDPTVIGGVQLPELTVGVYGEAGPFAVANAAGGAIHVVVGNGALPAGLSAQVRAGAVWITGVPLRSGQGSADLSLTVTHYLGLAGGPRSVTAPGTSVTVGWTVRALGRAAGQFNGYLVTDDIPGYGSATLAVTGSGSLSGRFVSDGLTYSINAAAFGGQTNGAFFVRTVAKAATNNLTVTVEVAIDGSAAELVVDGQGDDYYELRRNNWGEAEGIARVRAYLGYYTVALPVLTKSSTNAPSGTGYLTLTVAASGAVTYTGLLADGRSVSGSAVLLYGPDCCSAEDRVTFYVMTKPSGYGRNDGLYGLIYLAPGRDGNVKETTVMPAETESGLYWVNADPKAVFGYNPTSGQLPEGISGFTNTVDVTGGYYDKTVNLKTYYAGKQLFIGSVFSAPDDFDGKQGVSGYVLASVPEAIRLPATASSASSLTFPRSELVKSGTLVDFGDSANPWALTVSPDRATGLFTGSTKFFYQGVDGTGKELQKTKTIALKGVFLQARAAYQEYADWSGFYLVPDACQYLDAGGKPKSYPFNWSYDFRLVPQVIPEYIGGGSGCGTGTGPFPVIGE